MFNEKLISQIKDKKAYKTEIVRNYTEFLSKYPEIFSDLSNGSNFDFAIYDSNKSYKNDSPIEVFNVYRNGQGIEIKPGSAEDSDLQLSLSKYAVEKLIRTKTKDEYSKLLGNFYNHPNVEKEWIDFTLLKRTQIVIEKGYGKFAKTAGLIEG